MQWLTLQSSIAPAAELILPLNAGTAECDSSAGLVSFEDLHPKASKLERMVHTAQHEMPS